MLISIEKLRKEFSGAVAVRDISFTIDRPQMVGIIGPSGAGKSTLLRMINRLADATSARWWWTAPTCSTCAAVPSAGGSATAR